MMSDRRSKSVDFVRPLVTQSGKGSLRLLWRMLVVLILCALVALAAAGYWAHQTIYKKPAPLAAAAQAQEVIALDVPYGSSPRKVAQLLRTAGVELPEELMYRWFAHQPRIQSILSESAGDKVGGIRAGYYEFESGQSLHEMTQMMVQGIHPKVKFTIIEGWTFKQILQALGEQKGMEHTLQGKTPKQVLKALDIKPPFEGRFAPLTYTVSKGSTDAQLLKQAAEKMDGMLESAWKQRAAHSQIKSKEQLRILASLIEKETGQTADMPNISAVFHNRLRVGMLLQTDPTVIYGMGDKYDGNIRKRDLQTDTPWNTYTRAGLPPTPIATAGNAAIQAAANPPQNGYFYFVSKGNGHSYFGRNLKEHNRAVQHYIFKRGAEPVQH